MAYENPLHGQPGYGAQQDYYNEPQGNYPQQQGHYDQAYNQVGQCQSYGQTGLGDYQKPAGFRAEHDQQIQGTGAGQEGERGVLGALGGGAAGTYVGKKTCHSFLGAVGGAIMGSLAEDYAKSGRKPSCSPSRPPHLECHCHTPIHEPHCHQYHPPPKPDCHCQGPTHESYCHHYQAPQHPPGYSSGSFSGSGLGVFAGKYAADYMGKRS